MNRAWKSLNYFKEGDGESGGLAPSNNLSDVASASAARENLGVYSQSAVDAKVGVLALCKSDNGMLYFAGGGAEATPDLSSDTLSILFKTDFDFSVEQTVNVFFPFYIGKTTTGNFFSCQYGIANLLRVHRAVGSNAAYVGRFNRTDIAALATGEVNALAFVFKKLSDGNAQLSFFVNGIEVQNRSTATVAFPTFTNFVSINKWGSANTSAGTVGYSDFRIFNFDVSASDAPYTLADYQKGKRLPPTLSGVRLALENYTIARNTTTKLIKDTSGSGQDATVTSTGTVAGDMDKSIAVLVDEITTQISQTSTTNS